MWHLSSSRLVKLSLGLFLAGSGCAVEDGDRGNDITTGGPTVMEEDRCKSGEKRCQGGALQSCSGGSFQTSQVCGVGQICDPGRGCLDCSPVLPTTCVGDKVHTCNSNGTIGDEKETCQPLSSGNITSRIIKSGL